MSVYTVGHSRIVGLGVYLPDTRISSRAIMEEIDTATRFGISPDWLERTVGIKERRFAPEHMLPSDMATIAANEALDRAQVTPDEIDVIVYAGVIRDYIEPATAHLVQDKIGANNAIVFDVTNACHGFMNGIHLVDALIATGQVRRGMVVTGEQSSFCVRKNIESLKKTHDREAFVKLVGGLTVGDAGAAMILGPKIDPDAGFMGFMLKSEGQHAGMCVYGARGDGSTPLETDMTTIVKQHTDMHAAMYQSFMERLGWGAEDITKFVHHQVGIRAFKIHAGYSSVPTTHMSNTVTTCGNLVSATIPVNLYNLNKEGVVRDGDKVFIAGAGSGLSISQAGLVWQNVA